MKRSVWTILAAVSLFSFGCSGLDPVSQRQWEAKVFESPYEIVFRAVISLLEQKGHRITQADFQTGVIDTEPTEGKFKRMKVSAEVRPLGKNLTEVRARIDLEEKGLLGGGYKHEQPKLAMYDELFTEIELQVYREHFLKIERRSRPTP
jgi:hypothetical protein